MVINAAELIAQEVAKTNAPNFCNMPSRHIRAVIREKVHSAAVLHLEIDELLKLHTSFAGEDAPEINAPE